MIDVSFSMQELEYFLLILTRITCFIYVAPFFGMANTPNRVKIGFGFFVAMFVYSAMSPHEAIAYSSVGGYAILVMKEAVTGLLVGFGANICMSITALAGHIISIDIGLSMASVFDSTTREQTSLVGGLYQYVFMLMMLVSGVHRFILEALIETYELIPVAGAVFREDMLLKAMIDFLTQYFNIGFRICLPIFIVTLLLNVVLGILAKVSPQIHMFSVGIQLKIFVGLAVLFFTVGMLPNAADLIFTTMRKMMVAFVEAMM